MEDSQQKNPEQVDRPQETFRIPWKTFFQYWVVTGIVMSVGYFGLYWLGFGFSSLWNCLPAVWAAAFVFSALATADAQPPPAKAPAVEGPTVVNPEAIPAICADAPGGAPGRSVWDLGHELLTQRRWLLLLIMLVLVTTAVMTYYLFAATFKIEYAGESGILFRLPGQAVYYLPIIPQDRWQNTGIRLRKDEQFTVELTGRASPGSLQNIDRLAQHLREVEKWQKEGQKVPRPILREEPHEWPFSGPEGYDPRWYYGKNIIPLFENHHLKEYREGKNKDQSNAGFNTDKTLTVMGLPHNTIVGIILEEPNTPRRCAEADADGYDYRSEKDSERLILLSADSGKYPLHLSAGRSGKLWVVINDADAVRWDNAGMFFMKLTRYSWPQSPP